MSLDLTTTNVLLGILAAVSVLEAIAVLGVFLGAALVCRRLIKTIDGIESRHVAPASVRVNAILDDIKSVTSTVKGETSRMNQLLDWILDAIGRRRERRDYTADARHVSRPRWFTARFADGLDNDGSRRT